MRDWFVQRLIILITGSDRRALETRYLRIVCREIHDCETPIVSCQTQRQSFLLIRLHRGGIAIDLSVNETAVPTVSQLMKIASCTRILNKMNNPQLVSALCFTLSWMFLVGIRGILRIPMSFYWKRASVIFVNPIMNIAYLHGI